MTTTVEQNARVLRYFDGVGQWLGKAIEPFVAGSESVEEIVAAGRVVFSKMLDSKQIPYIDRPDHTMANSMFASAAMLAVFKVLRERGIDAHSWGRNIQSLPNVLPRVDVDARLRGLERSRADALVSQSSATPNEFVWESVPGPASTDGGMNITSCAICHLFGRHDAMELVPYMCAFDDVVSRTQGLRRTGTIALGSQFCDFRFDATGEPLPLAEQFPKQIRMK
jgi:hypothetical protein